MQIELSEILTCPDCRSPQGLVVLVDELDDPVGVGPALHGVEHLLGSALGSDPEPKAAHLREGLDHVLVQFVCTYQPDHRSSVPKRHWDRWV